MKEMMKVPLLLAAAVVIIRVVLEQINGVPTAVQAIFGVAWLHLLVPIYFALKISDSGDATPFKTLIKDSALYHVYVRLMVIPTYMLAYAFSWPATRFNLDNGGVVAGAGDEVVSPLMGYLVIPLRNAALWVVAMTIIGGVILGGLTLLIRRRVAAKSA